MQTFLQAVRIITFVALFLDARTHHVDKSILPDEDTSNHFHVNHDVIKTYDKPSGLTNIFDYVVTRPTLFRVVLLIPAIGFGCYVYCLARWALDDESTVVEILRDSVFCLCFPLTYVLLLFSFLWRKIVELTRPAIDENSNEVRFRTRNNNPNVQEIDE